MPLTSYPAAIDVFPIRQDGPDQWIFAAHMNYVQDAIAAIEATLGINPQGSSPTVNERIATYLPLIGGTLTGDLKISQSKLRVGGIGTAVPQAILHLGIWDTSGIVGDNAVIIGKPHPSFNIGELAVIEGSGTSASGNNSHAEGLSTIASGQNSHAEGASSQATAVNSHAEGGGTQAIAAQAHAEGGGTQATAVNAHSEGGGTIASGQNSHAEGGGAAASGTNSHAEGGGTIASNDQAHAEGASSTASGVNAHAEGASTLASGTNSHAENSGTTASGTNSHADGLSTLASGLNSKAGGTGSKANADFSYAHGTQCETDGKVGSRIVSDSRQKIVRSDADDQYKSRFNNGWRFVKGNVNDNEDSVNYEILQGIVKTTGALADQLQSILTKNDSVILLETRIVARRTGGIAGAAGDSFVEVKKIRIKNIAGTVTLHDETQEFISQDQVWSSAFVISGVNVLLNVTGAVDNDITWHVTTKLQEVLTN